jgi:hypothetical protein
MGMEVVTDGGGQDWTTNLPGNLASCVTKPRPVSTMHVRARAFDMRLTRSLEILGPVIAHGLMCRSPRLGIGCR